jgi:adenylate cyclase
MHETGLRQRLTAILAADVAGYSRLMGVDERATVAALDAARDVFRAQVESHQGRVIDMARDSVLAVFETATGAVGAALARSRRQGGCRCESACAGLGARRTTGRSTATA